MNSRNVLTEKVYELIPDYDPKLDQVTILTFRPDKVILGITCGQRQDTKVKSEFEYLAMVENNILKVFRIDECNEYTTVYFECKEEDMDFPKSLLEILNKGTSFRDDDELYNFLESYSS